MHLHTELHVAGQIVLRRDETESATPECRSRHTEVDLIKDIEGLHSKLEPQVLVYWKVFDN